MCICAVKQDLVSSADMYIRQSDLKNYQLEIQERGTEPEHDAAPEVKEAHNDQQAFSQVRFCTT